MTRRQATHTTSAAPIETIDWDAAAAGLAAEGVASLGRLLPAEACDAFIAGYDDDARYRSTVEMARHGFGQGQYRYFAAPCGILADLRAALYPPLAAIANDWSKTLSLPQRFPANHGDFIQQCRAAGQARPTPLILRYGPGDYNCLHQDLYGAVHFPLQAMIMLSDPETDFDGGEFIITEQRPRMQSRATALRPRRGEALVFAVNERPKIGTRGPYRVKMRHGVSAVRAGRRFALGIIFHDAA